MASLNQPGADGTIAPGAPALRKTAWIGIAATIWFWLCLAIFAAVRPEFSHFTKSVSELGISGADNALLWNILGFGVTGLLLAWFGWLFGRLVTPDKSWIAVWLAISGLAFTATGVFPADMSNWWAPTTVTHIAMSLLVQVAWFIGIYPLYGLRRTRWDGMIRLTTWMIVVLLLVFMLRWVPGLLPGFTQRLAFVVYFAWYLLASILLLRMARGGGEAAAGDGS
jgi:hypothetical membrane protein